VNQNSNKTVLNSESPADRLTKTIYEAGAGEIFWRNFLAGFSRGLGMLFVYLVLIFVVGLVFVQYINPFISPLYNNLSSLTKSLETIQGIQGIK